MSASQYVIPITRTPKPGTDDIYLFMQHKYLFEPMSKQLISCMVKESAYLEYLSSTTDEAEESLANAKEFLKTMIEKNKHLVQEGENV